MSNHLHQCVRCGGTMVESYDDVASPDDIGKDVIGWRCVNCGDYVDELVLQNRGMQQGGAYISFRSVRERSPMHRVPPLAIHRRRAVA
ncbi:MAG: hypothetical protein NW202_03630 [Nitrospira sp.]|nr:hypothetical protein [Nitrospira sp.]